MPDGIGFALIMRNNGDCRSPPPRGQSTKLLAHRLADNGRLKAGGDNADY
jgi:hypothetical protein